MPRIKTRAEKAAGKLISSIQKEWGNEIGEPTYEESEKVMDKGHDLLQAKSSDQMEKLLNGKSIEHFLGKKWVKAHPNVHPLIQALAEAIRSEKT